MEQMQALAEIDRPELGDTIPLAVFRIFRQFSAQYSAEILGESGVKTTFTYAGKMLGHDVGKQLYSSDLPKYLSSVQEFVYDAKIGVLDLVDSDSEQMVFQLGECVTCAGMPDMGLSICYFEVGLVAGIVETFVKNDVGAFESKCNVNGDECCEVTIQLDPVAALMNS